MKNLRYFNNLFDYLFVLHKILDDTEISLLRLCCQLDLCDDLGIVDLDLWSRHDFLVDVLDDIDIKLFFIDDSLFKFRNYF